MACYVCGIGVLRLWHRLLWRSASESGRLCRRGWGPGARRATPESASVGYYGLDLKLSAEQLRSLDGASQIEPGFPQSIYEKEMARTTRYGGMWDRLVMDGGMLAQ